MDTIVAISTAPGIGGIGIIRMSGKETFEILEKIFTPKNKGGIVGNSIKYGYIKEKSKVIDEVLVSYFKAPKSYTTESMCEINSHGGRVVMEQIVELCLQNGAVLALPGEFTKRAFLNGRIDLSQAEATIDIINAKTRKEKEASVNQLEGRLSKEISNLRSQILDIIVDIEASIDYPEYDIEEVTNQKALVSLEKIEENLIRLEKTYETGKILKEGISVAIIGKPNSGKSSLLNALLREDRAIVTDIEGTTRDSIEEFIQIDGIPVKIIDTAGIRDTKDKVESIGIEKAKQIAQKADLVIAIFDRSKEIEKEDEEILKIVKDKKAIIVLNKIDLKEDKVKDNIFIKNMKKETIEISALNGSGIEKIEEKIISLFKANEIVLEGQITITNIRHKELITKAIKSTKNAKYDILNNMPIDIISINIKEVLENLGEITGEAVSEEIINHIFSKFCLGK